MASDDVYDEGALSPHGYVAVVQSKCTKLPVQVSVGLENLDECLRYPHAVDDEVFFFRLLGRHSLPLKDEDLAWLAAHK